MLALCDAMEWKHLPQVGGLYQQHPDFIDAAFLLFQARSRHEAAKRRQEEQRQKQQSPRGMTGARRGRR